MSGKGVSPHSPNSLGDESPEVEPTKPTQHPHLGRGQFAIAAVGNLYYSKLLYAWLLMFSPKLKTKHFASILMPTDSHKEFLLLNFGKRRERGEEEEESRIRSSSSSLNTNRSFLFRIKDMKTSDHEGFSPSHQVL